MAKTYGATRKWTKGRSRIVRPTDQTRLLQGITESIRIVANRLPWFARKKS